MPRSKGTVRRAALLGLLRVKLLLALDHFFRCCTFLLHSLAAIIGAVELTYTSRNMLEVGFYK